MNINSVAWLLANVISLENLATQQHILQRSADEIRVGVEMIISKLIGVLK